MNLLTKIIGIILAVSIIVIAADMMIEIDDHSESKKASSTVELTYDVGTKIIDRRFIPPGSYELLYRTTFENGLSVDKWEEVTPDEYKNYLNKETEVPNGR